MSVARSARSSAAARRDPEFGIGLQKAELRPGLTQLEQHQCGRQGRSRYWRAAAWALEHLYPEDYALRRPRSMSAEQICRGAYQICRR